MHRFLSPPLVDDFTLLPPSLKDKLFEQADDNDVPSSTIVVHPAVEPDYFVWQNGIKIDLPKVRKRRAFLISHIQTLANVVEFPPSYLEQINPTSADIQSSLAKYTPVVVQTGYYLSFGDHFSVQSLKKSTLLSKFTPVTGIDMNGESQTFNLGDFFSHTEQSLAVLQIPVVYPPYMDIQILREVDHSRRIAWTNGDFLVPQQRPLEIDHHGSYLHLYHRGYHRSVTHFAEGYCSYIKVLCGRLIMIFPEINDQYAFLSRTNLYAQWREVSPVFDPEDEGYKAYIKRSFKAVVIKPGHYIILPPGLYYEIIAADDTTCIGSCFYNTETLHLTELSRRYDSIYTDQTGIDPSIAHLTLSLMMNNYGFCDHYFFKLRPLMALTSMVLNPAKYFQPSEDTRPSQISTDLIVWQLEGILLDHIINDGPCNIHYDADSSIPNAPIEKARTIEKALEINSNQYTTSFVGDAFTMSGVDYITLGPHPIYKPLQILSRLADGLRALHSLRNHEWREEMHSTAIRNYELLFQA